MKSMSQLVNWGLSFVCTLVVLATGAAAASEAPITPEAEFPVEAEALAAATAALFDDIEASLDARVEDDGKLQIRILGDAIPINAAPRDPLIEAFPVERGPVNHLTGYRITWYPVDRFLGVVDFIGTYDGNRNLVCGFVTWDMTDPDAPKLEHLKATYVDLVRLRAFPASATRETLLNANCASGEVAPNFEALVVSR